MSEMIMETYMHAYYPQVTDAKSWYHLIMVFLISRDPPMPSKCFSSISRFDRMYKLALNQQQKHSHRIELVEPTFQPHRPSMNRLMAV